MKLDSADTAFSNYIRTRDNWTCRRCFTQHTPPTRALHCSHYFGRNSENTRFEPDNCIALCYGCHKYFDEHNRPAYTEFKKKELGEIRLMSLEIQHNTYKKKDRKMELIKWRLALESIK